MTVHLIGLAYDQVAADSVWGGMTARQAYDLIAEDDFRRKVDFRSMLYHKGQIDLLGELGHFLRQGGERISLMELMADRFAAGVEELPTPSGEFELDFQLIRYFSSLAMSDDFLAADPFLRKLLRGVGFLREETRWSLPEVADFEGIASALGNARMKEILEAAESVGSSQAGISYESLVGNYIEFLGYSRNNALTPFFFNSRSDVERRGNLPQRRNERIERVVDLSLSRGKSRKRNVAVGRSKEGGEGRNPDLQSRMKRRREREVLILGLRDLDPLIRQKAAESLARLADGETLPHLLEALSDPEPEVRQEIVRAVGAVPGEEASQALRTVLIRDEIPAVRRIAAYILRKRGDPAALSILIDQLERRNDAISVDLAYHPSLPKDPAALDRLFRLSVSGFPEVRREVAFVAGRVPSKRSEALLETLAEDPDEETRRNALYSMWEIGAANTRKTALHLASSRSVETSRAGTVVAHWAEKR